VFAVLNLALFVLTGAAQFLLFFLLGLFPLVSGLVGMSKRKKEAKAEEERWKGIVAGSRERDPLSANMSYPLSSGVSPSVNPYSSFVVPRSFSASISPSPIPPTIPSYPVSVSPFQEQYLSGGCRETLPAVDSCGHCGNTWVSDRRGRCASCGAPKIRKKGVH
jgi:hypothetical protein